MKGRKPKPTALKILEGNPGKRKLSDDEPKPPPGAPPMPSHLKGSAATEWKRIVPLLEGLGLLTRVDLVALACYCSAWGRHLQAERKLSKEGLTLVNELGNTVANPLIKISENSAKLAHKFLIEFGLTPSTRARLHVKPTEQSPEEELKEFMRIAQ